MSALTTREALVALTTQAMVTGYVTLLRQQEAIRQKLASGMTAGDAVIAVLGDEPSQFLETRRDLAEPFVDAAALADDQPRLGEFAEVVYRALNRKLGEPDQGSGSNSRRWDLAFDVAEAMLRALSERAS